MNMNEMHGLTMPINTSNALLIVWIVGKNNAYCYNIPDSYLGI